MSTGAELIGAVHGFVDRVAPAPAERDDRQTIARLTPVLEDVLDADGKLLTCGVYPQALEAKARGETYVYVEASAVGRPWAPFIWAFGVRAQVMKRFRSLPNVPGASVDSGPVTRLIVRFAIHDVLAAYKRHFIRTRTPRKIVPANRRRRLPTGVMIR